MSCYEVKEHSDTVKKDEFIRQSVDVGNEVEEGSRLDVVYSLGKEPSVEFKNALIKAESYSDLLHMSKQAIYDQLVSKHGEGFSKEAAKWGIDNMETDWNANALEKARSYRDLMNMSKKKIYDQLISKYGEKFTKSEAKYAIDHLDD